MTRHADPLASRIDHAVLHPGAIRQDVEEAARRCMAHGVRGVCVTPRRVREAAGVARGSAVRVVAVAGFPAAASRPDRVVLEIEDAVADGADEIDAVLPLGEVVRGDLSALRDEASALVRAAGGRPVKLIVEVSAVDHARLARAIAEVVVPSGARWLKTGTGVYSEALAPARVRAVRALLPAGIGLKVAGGVRRRAEAEAALAAGADVVGTSSTFRLLRSPETGP